MALQLRRGTNTNRLTVTPAQGEPLYTTDTKQLYIGDGTTAGGNPVSPVTSVNSLTGAVSLTTDNIAEGTTVGKTYFTDNRASDAVGAMLAAGTLSNITVSYNSTTHAITISSPSVIQSGTVVGGYSGLAYWPSNGTSLSQTQNLTYSESTNGLVMLNGNLAGVSNFTGMQMATFSTFSTSPLSNHFTFRRAGGTNITPSTVVSGYGFQTVQWQAFDGTGYNTAASIASSAVNTVSTGIIPAQLQFNVSGVTANSLYPRLTLSGYGDATNATAIFGPNITTDGGTGAVLIRQTVSSNAISGVISSNYYSDTYGSRISLRKYRGTFASPTAVLQNDELALITARGYDGATSLAAAQIQMVVSGAVSTGVAPGSIIFKTANNAGVMTTATTIDNSQTLTHSGSMVVAGNLIVQGTTTNFNSSTITIDDKNIELGSVAAQTISATGTVGSITGTGPWTATITNMVSTTDLIVGSTITATGGTGTLYGGSPTSVLVASIESATSITYTVTGGTTPTAGTVTAIATSGATDNTANGGGITLKGSTDKTFQWNSSTNAWTSSENVVVASGKTLAVNGNTTLAGGSLIFSGNISAPAWTTSGIRHVSVPAIFTDTTSTGTVANAYSNSFGGNTIAASNTVTFTNYGTVFLNSPTAGTNVTFTNAYSLITAGAVLLGGGLTGAATQNVFNTLSTTVNAFGASTATTVGASTGTHTVNNATVTLANATALNVNGVSPTLASTSTGTLTLFNTNLLTVAAFNAATTAALVNSATTLSIGNTATAAQTANMFTASTGASTYNFATGATASATTKAINIGTSGVSGSTTNIALGSSVSGATSLTTINGALKVTDVRDTVFAATFAATFTPDAANGSIQNITLTGNITINVFANPVAGQTITLILSQDATGSRILSSTMKFAGGIKTLSTSAASIDMLTITYTGSVYYASLVTGFA